MKKPAETITLRRPDGSLNVVEVHDLSSFVPKRPTAARAPKCTPANLVKLANAFRHFLAEEIEGGAVAYDDHDFGATCSELLLIAYEHTFSHPVNAAAQHCAELIMRTEEFVAYAAATGRFTKLTIADLEAFYSDPSAERRSSGGIPRRIASPAFAPGSLVKFAGRSFDWRIVSLYSDRILRLELALLHSADDKLQTVARVADLTLA